MNEKHPRPGSKFILALCLFSLFATPTAVALVRANGETGAFAAPDRINLFEDEAGTHVSVVNPRSLNRTLLMEDSAHAEMTETHLQKLRAMILAAVPGKKSARQYGQMRDRGLIGKTMGVVAGGKFGDLIKEIAKVDGGDLAEVVGRLEQGLAKEIKKQVKKGLKG